MDFKGRVAVVTGATRGIGKAIAEGFAGKGVDLVVSARNEDAAREVAASLSATGVKAIGMRLDVTNSEEVERVFEEIRNEFSRIDILVNNAGITKDGLLMRMKEDAWDAVLDTNLKGVFLCSREVIKDTAGLSILLLWPPSWETRGRQITARQRQG
jgi:3-oxoacyl-[acyl-carrier protein] reductase